MAQLINETGKSIIVEKLEVADSFFKRLKGLLGKESMEDGTALWIRNANSIHTFFMKFEIDVMFLDKNLKVKKCIQGVKPNEIIWPIWGARSVVEMKAGHLKKINVTVGDQLHVVH